MKSRFGLRRRMDCLYCLCGRCIRFHSREGRKARMRCTTPAAPRVRSRLPPASYILASPIVGLQSPLATAEPIPGFGQPPISPNKTCQRTLRTRSATKGQRLRSSPLPRCPPAQRPPSRARLQAERRSPPAATGGTSRRRGRMAGTTACRRAARILDGPRPASKGPGGLI